MTGAVVAVALAAVALGAHARTPVTTSVTTSVPTSVTATNDYTLVPGTRAGPYRYLEALRAGRSYPAAVAAFGPGKPVSQAGNLCTVRFEAAGADVSFAGRPSACAKANLARGAWYGLRLWGSRWHTARGLKVGDGVARVRAVYPKATLHRSAGQTSYWLSTWRFEAGSPLSPLLEALVTGGKVTALVVHPQYVF